MYFIDLKLGSHTVAALKKHTHQKEHIKRDTATVCFVEASRSLVVGGMGVFSAHPSPLTHDPLWAISSLPQLFKVTGWDSNIPMLRNSLDEGLPSERSPEVTLWIIAFQGQSVCQSDRYKNTIKRVGSTRSPCDTSSTSLVVKIHSPANTKADFGAANSTFAGRSFRDRLGRLHTTGYLEW